MTVRDYTSQILNTLNMYHPNVQPIDFSGVVDNFQSAYDKSKQKYLNNALASALQSGDETAINSALAKADPMTAVANRLAQQQRQQQRDWQLEDAERSHNWDIEKINLQQKLARELADYKASLGGSESPFNSKNEFINLMGIKNNPTVWNNLPAEDKMRINARLNYMANNPENVYENAYQKASGKTMGEFGGERQKEEQLGYYREGGQKYVAPNTEAEENYLSKNSQKLTNNETVARTAETVLDDIKAVKEMARENPQAAASWGSLTSFIPGTPAANIKARIESIKADSGVDSLLKIKASGAGLGQIPQSQMDMLSSLIGNLDQAQSLPNLLDILNRYERIYTDVYNNAVSDNKKIREKIKQPMMKPMPTNNGGETIMDAADYFQENK